VRDGVRYDRPVRDVVFILLAAGFFTLTVLFVRACERLVGVRRPLDEEERRS
jgi:hypothetical protein